MNSNRQKFLPSQSVCSLVASADAAVLCGGLIGCGPRASVLHGLAQYLTSLALELMRRLLEAKTFVPQGQDASHATYPAYFPAYL